MPTNAQMSGASGPKRGSRMIPGGPGRDPLFHGARSDENIESAGTMGTWADVLRLPPLPEPDYTTMRSEACYGNCFVLFLIFFFVAPIQGWAFSSDSPTVSFWLVLIYAEAVIAIVCLIGLMWGDPGTLKRSPETCYPQPAAVVERLQSGVNLLGAGRFGNVTEGDRVFCIRCLMWRPDETVHHCRTCQRCVRDFDHHCGVFGRCIAGEGLSGNLGYFKILILMVRAPQFQPLTNECFLLLQPCVCVRVCSSLTPCMSVGRMPVMCVRRALPDS